MSFWSDLLDVISSSAGNEGAVTSPSSSVGPDLATSWPGSFLTLAEGVWTELTDGKLWRSLGWLLLGIVLMLLGVLWWIGPSAARRSPAGAAAEGLL